MKNKLIPTLILGLGTFLATQKVTAQYKGGDGSGGDSNTTDTVKKKQPARIYGSQNYQYSEAISGGMLPNTPYSFSHYKYVEKNSKDTTFELFAGNTMGQGFLSKIVKGKKGYNVSLATNGAMADYYESSGVESQENLQQSMSVIADAGAHDPIKANMIMQQFTRWGMGEDKFSSKSFVAFAAGLKNN